VPADTQVVEVYGGRVVIPLPNIPNRGL